MRRLRDAVRDDAAMLCAAERAVVRQYDAMLVSEANELFEPLFVQRIASLADGRGKYLIAEDEGVAVGHGCLWPMPLRRIAHVLRLDLCVHVGHWRQGHGEALLRALLDWAAGQPSARKVELLVRAGNDGAVALYRKLGFVEEGRLRERVRLPGGGFVDDISMAFMLPQR